jgi:thymidylate synthase (FAD)
MQTKRLVNAGLEEEMGISHPVLDKGYIKLVDYMGTDETIVAAARHSYDKGLDLDDHTGNAKLIDYLMKHRHTSPFEQPALVFEVKAPIFVFREWHRHRTAKLNEMSARYTVMPNEFYVPAPERVALQAKNNKQGSGVEMPAKFQEFWTNEYADNMNRVFSLYEFACAEDMAKEVARVALPVSTYSKMVWQCDLHNLTHFLKLRMAPTAQFEIREYADQIAETVKVGFPKVWSSFDNHVLRARTISGDDIAVLNDLLMNEPDGAFNIREFLAKKGIL